METSLQTFIGIFALAVVTEGIVEWLLGYWTFEGPWRFGKAWIAALFGVAVCWYYGADLLAAIGLPRVSPIGEILTGASIGRGSNYLNTLWKRALVVPAPAQPVETVAKPDSTWST